VPWLFAWNVREMEFVTDFIRRSPLGLRINALSADLGFPAGNDKTVLIDLPGLFPPAGPRTLWLRTNLEIFWDRPGWAAGRPDVTPEPRRLDLKTADLRFRGYSVTEQKDASTPERARYVVEGVAPRWRDLEGWHTRFGDVREPLRAVDDRYVIMNAGDELRLAYPEAPPPAPGMVRDFVLVGDGWERTATTTRRVTNRAALADAPLCPVRARIGPARRRSRLPAPSG
jgi:hypothetical protein